MNSLCKRLPNSKLDRSSGLPHRVNAVLTSNCHKAAGNSSISRQRVQNYIAIRVHFQRVWLLYMLNMIVTQMHWCFFHQLPYTAVRLDYQLHVITTTCGCRKSNTFHHQILTRPVQAI